MTGTVGDAPSRLTAGPIAAGAELDCGRALGTLDEAWIWGGGVMPVAEVPKAAFPQIWPRMLPIVEAALKRGNGEYEPEDVLAALQSGEWRALIATQPGKLRAIAICGVVPYPRSRHLWVHVAGGEGAAEGVAAMMPALRQLAREGKCDRIRFQGRRGWARSGALPGWRHSADIVTMEV
jgi:hypothetical protein